MVTAAGATRPSLSASEGSPGAAGAAGAAGVAGASGVPNQGAALDRALASLGHFGLYQRYTLLLLCIPNLLAAMYTLNYVFVADQVPFRCLVPECETFGSTQFKESWVASLLEQNSCRRPAPLSSPPALHQNCTIDHFDIQENITCEQLIYLNQDTIFSEFDLGCSEWQRTLVGTVRNSALPIALLITGFVSDRYGRLRAFCVMSACAGVLGLLKSFSLNYPMYLASEFLEAMLGYGFNTAAYVMMVETAHSSQRAAFACCTGISYGLGGVLFALTAWRVQNWRLLLRVIHAPALLLPLYALMLTDPPRWLHAKGCVEKTLTALRRAARWNKKQLDEELMKEVESECSIGREQAAKEGNPWLSVVKSRVLMFRLVTCSWCWISSSFIYYGLTINSVTLSGDKYVNFALNMAMEVVASLLLWMALERFGRKRSILVSFLMCGVACVTPYFVAHTRAGFSLFFVGKLSITFAFNCVYMFTAELFPTRVRSSALAACSLIGRLGSVLAPQTPLLALNAQALVYGAVSLSAALVVLAAPETAHRPLPTSTVAAEHLADTTTTATTTT